MSEELPSNRPTIIDDEEFQLSSSDTDEEQPSTSTPKSPFLPDENAAEDLKQALQDSTAQQSVLPILKHELKYKILYRRHSEGKGEVDLSEEPKTYELSEEEIQRKETRRRRNRESAERVKKRELELEIKLKKKIDILSQENYKLTNMKIKLLRNKREILSQLKEMGCEPDGVRCTCERNISIISENTTEEEGPLQEKHLVLITRKGEVDKSSIKDIGYKDQSESQRKSDTVSNKRSYELGERNTEVEIEESKLFITDRTALFGGTVLKEDKGISVTTISSDDPDSLSIASSVIPDKEEPESIRKLSSEDSESVKIPETSEDTTSSSDEERPLLIDESGE